MVGMEKCTKCTYVFLPCHRVSCLDSIFIYTSQILYHMYFPSHSISTSFLFSFLFHLGLTLNFMAFSANEIGYNIFIHLQPDQHPFVVLLFSLSCAINPCSNFQNPSNSLQKINKISIGSEKPPPHTGSPPKGTNSFNKP